MCRRRLGFSEASFSASAEEHDIDGTTIRIFNPEKTIADCFKFRNTLGMNIVLAALKLYKQCGHFKVDALLEYTTVCRVKKIMRPYLEVMIRITKLKKRKGEITAKTYLWESLDY